MNDEVAFETIGGDGGFYDRVSCTITGNLGLAPEVKEGLVHARLAVQRGSKMFWVSLFAREWAMSMLARLPGGAKVLVEGRASYKLVTVRDPQGQVVELPIFEAINVDKIYCIRLPPRESKTPAEVPDLDLTSVEGLPYPVPGVEGLGSARGAQPVG